MKFMEKAKRFFTLSAKREGFTLVELIVVIAILAILAGVAVPAYSGYIKEADKAADLTSLNAVQTAVNAMYSTEGSLPTKIVVKDNGETGDTVTVSGAKDKAGNEIAATDVAGVEDFKLFYGVKDKEAFDIELNYSKTYTWEKNAEGKFEWK